MISVLIVLAGFGLCLVLIVVGVLWSVKAFVLRPDRVRNTYQVVGAVYTDRDGDEWVVSEPGRLISPALNISFSMAAQVVEERCGPLVYVRREETTS